MARMMPLDPIARYFIGEMNDLLRRDEQAAKVANLREWLEEETEREVALLEPVLHRTVQAIVAERPDVGGCIQ